MDLAPGFFGRPAPLRFPPRPPRLTLAGGIAAISSRRRSIADGVTEFKTGLIVVTADVICRAIPGAPSALIASSLPGLSAIRRRLRIYVYGLPFGFRRSIKPRLESFRYPAETLHNRQHRRVDTVRRRADFLSFCR